MAQSDVSGKPQWHIGQAIAGWLLPGLGHILLGERRRGAILGVSIGLLWVSGLLIGGVGVCDRDIRPYWFAGQALLAPTIVVDYFQRDVNMGQDTPASQQIRTQSVGPSFGHMNEQGILYTALAGLLNLLAIIDVAYRDPSRFKAAGQKTGQAAGGHS